MSTPEPLPPLPARTTPTWEVELLISGVAVFAMTQLPGLLDDAMFALEPRMSSDWRTLLMLFYFYTKSATVVLAITFIVHLLLRAHWIALMGMHSVYPDGVRLERLKMGPIQRAIESGRLGDSETAIERADNRASVIFAIGVTIAMILGFVSLSVCGTLLAVTLLAQLAGVTVEPAVILLATFAAIMLPFFAASAIDTHFGQRLPPHGRTHRFISALLRFYLRFGMGRLNNRVVALLTSNGGERRMHALVFGALLATIVGVAVAYHVMRDQDIVGNFAWFPKAHVPQIDAAHYDDQRDTARDPAKPFVKSMVVTGPYLTLVIPYAPRRDEPVMRSCAVQPGADAAQRAATLLDCLQGIRAVSLDGAPIADLQYDVASDPRTGRPALLAMIDVRDLPPGRHELRIAYPLREDREPDPARPDPGYDLIPFWR